MQSLETVSHALSWSEHVFIVSSGDLAPQKEQLLGALVCFIRVCGLGEMRGAKSIF